MDGDPNLTVQTLLSSQFDISIQTDYESFQNELAARINELIQTDFTNLVNILYRIDVDESKLRQTLKNKINEDPGYTIAKLVIERQLEKVKIRNDFKIDPDPGQEKW